MPTHRFEEIKRSVTRKLKCECGKRFQRTRAFTQTVNPFNRNADGTVKTRREIWLELNAKAVKWQPDDVRCTACQDAARAEAAT